MKAIACTNYGEPEVLQVKEFPKPKPKKNEILVKVVASAVNTADVRIRGLKVKGLMKLVMRVVLGVSKPRKPILGTVFSGIIEELGSDVTHFKLEQEVYGSTGFSLGCHAEYLCISENKPIAAKPSNASFEEAAAILFGGQTAIYFLRKGKITSLKNPQVLIYGSTGSVGTAAVQIAKHYNAKVTAVCSSKGKELSKRLLADNIVLYDQEDFTQLAEKFDIIFDAVGKISKKKCKHLLKSNGKFFSVEGLDVADERKEYLHFLKQLYESGTYDASIDKTFTINEIQEAHRYVDTGKKKGNVVLKIAGD